MLWNLLRHFKKERKKQKRKRESVLAAAQTQKTYFSFPGKADHSFLNVQSTLIEWPLYYASWVCFRLQRSQVTLSLPPYSTKLSFDAGSAIGLWLWRLADDPGELQCGDLLDSVERAEPLKIKDGKSQMKFFDFNCLWSGRGLWQRLIKEK